MVKALECYEFFCISEPLFQAAEKNIDNWNIKMSGDKLKVEMENIQQQMVEAKKNERANAL